MTFSFKLHGQTVGQYRSIVWQLDSQFLAYDLLSWSFCFISPGLGRLSQAEEYLAQAQWTVLKTPECPDSIKSKLFRNLGLLYAAQGNYPDALSQLSDDVRTW